VEIILDQQRMAHIEDFIVAMNSLYSKYGVLFSGPNGVGMSTICLMSSVFAFAQKLNFVYIPMADSWASAKNEKAARLAFMERFFRQNADLIISHPNLRRFFEPMIQLRTRAKDADLNYMELSEALNQRSGDLPVCGYIVDEVQRLTNKAKTSKSKAFFLEDFTIWTSHSSSFRSQLCASAHGLREFSIPSGEEPRLQFVKPFTSEDMEILLMHSASPFFDPIFSQDASFRSRVVQLTGGVPRDVAMLASQLRRARAANPSIQKSQVMAIADSVFSQIQAAKLSTSFSSWWQISKAGVNVSPKVKLNALMRLLEGCADFEPVIKDLYDFGLLYVNKWLTVTPVSGLAHLALHQLFSLVAPNVLPPLSQVPELERGSNFEQQLLAAMLQPIPTYVSMFRARSPSVELSTRIDATITRAVEQKDDELLRLLQSHDSMRVLWRSRAQNCRFDGILVPPVSDTESPIVIFDSSVTSPYHGDRIKKMNFLAQHYAPLVTTKFPTRKVIVTSFWSDNFMPLSFKPKTFENVLSDLVYVVDANRLRNSSCQIRF
jgi:hypothetical protein